jgi:hypothetical protein
VLKYVFGGLAGLVIGAPLGGAAGFVTYNVIWPPHGCGNIGCWDALIGAMVGAPVGGIALTVAAVFAVRAMTRPPPNTASPT